jgi:hypothetical protein
MDPMYLVPSFYAHIINGVFLLIALILIYNKFPKIISLDPYKLIVIILLLSIGVGVHGISHLGLEKGYDYNPLTI